MQPDVQFEVSVIIPCLNEASSLGSCIEKAMAAFQAVGLRGEVVVADNGSTDGSIEIAKEHSARVVHAVPRGYGNALRAGIAAARGKFIVMGDADDSYDFSQVPQFVAKWREGYELVMGNRFKGEIKRGAMPWHHQHIGTPFLTAMLNFLFHAGIGDAFCGLRGFTRDLYGRMNLRTTGMEFALESIIKAAQLGARITEIPVTLWPDKPGRAPHLRSFRDGSRSLGVMLMLAPKALVLVAGGLLAAVGLALVLWLLPGPQQAGRVVLDLHTMLLGMVFALLGVQLLLCSLLARAFRDSDPPTRQPSSRKRESGITGPKYSLLAGWALTVMGLGGNAWTIWREVASREGPLHDVRAVIFWSLWLLVGLQVILSSALLGNLVSERGDSQGGDPNTG